MYDLPVRLYHYQNMPRHWSYGHRFEGSSMSVSPLTLSHTFMTWRLATSNYFPSYHFLTNFDPCSDLLMAHRDFKKWIPSCPYHGPTWPNCLLIRARQARSAAGTTRRGPCSALEVPVVKDGEWNGCRDDGPGAPCQHHLPVCWHTFQHAPTSWVSSRHQTYDNVIEDELLVSFSTELQHAGWCWLAEIPSNYAKLIAVDILAYEAYWGGHWWKECSVTLNPANREDLRICSRWRPGNLEGASVCLGIAEIKVSAPQQLPRDCKYYIYI